ncbi:MAG: hypothetical protein D6763_04460 [Alphaproteobacteria bacterium]|nr:MAG: hypothetical protein D6763_04460 [Alphaproteobacteria bacterium]
MRWCVLAGTGGRCRMVVHGSHPYVSFKLTGRTAMGGMRRVCSLDLDGPDFRDGSAVQSHLGQLPVLLEFLCEDPQFRLTVDQSLSQFAWNWLTALARDVDLGKG